ncbi:hypothetical protein EC973_004671 [Apophysomyces ossiformis]|uniref:Transmembrane 9 superfamily member n=1 Tax=Apophysomyces ossiformis TaxID=679940 RepID=A0A8H7BL01_9FUNG|nr:hypothetical protein EC973_004671 [Apophysomyces ossiformis]
MNLQESRLTLAWSLLTLSLLSSCAAFSLPGTAARAFKWNESVPLLVNKIFSYRTQLPYTYDDLSFVCKPQSIHWEGLNLGEVLQGDRLMRSGHDIRMAQNMVCSTLCTVSLTEEQSKELREYIYYGYKAEWQI